LAVIVPTFVLVTIVQNKLTKPILEQDIRQIGEQSGARLAAEIVSDRLLSLPKPSDPISDRVQEILYQQPNIMRIDVIAKDRATGTPKIIASSVEEDPADPDVPPAAYELVQQTTSEYKVDDSGVGLWDIHVPIEQKGRDPRAIRHYLGTVHIVISNKLMARVATTLW